MTPTYKVRNSEKNGIKIMSLLTGFLFFLLCSVNSYAHKVNMFAYGEGETVFVEGYFADGKKAQNSEVVVVDNEGNEVAKGTTNEKGQFSFIYPKNTDLIITVDAGMGHKSEQRITESEISDDGDEEETSELKTPELKTSEPSSTQPTRDQNVASTATTSVDTKQIRLEIEKAVGKAIKPLMRQVSEMREEKSFAEVIGGIGFIFGGLGMFMYYKARKMEQK